MKRKHPPPSSTITPPPGDHLGWRPPYKPTQSMDVVYDLLREESPSLGEQALLRNIKSRLPELERLLAEVSDPNVFEESFYRFYFRSHKVYSVLAETKRIVATLESLTAGLAPLCRPFTDLVAEAMKKPFGPDTQDVREGAAVVIEAFLHAKTFLELAVRYGKTLDKAPRILPYGWAALLALYGLR